MRVSSAEKILAQRVVHIAAGLVHQGAEKKIAAILNGRHCDKNDPGHQPCLASHVLLFLWDAWPSDVFRYCLDEAIQRHDSMADLFEIRRRTTWPFHIHSPESTMSGT